MRQQKGERHDDDDLAEEREEHRLLRLAEADEGALPRKLERHEEESEKIEVHRGHAEVDQLGILHEDGEKRLREEE